MGQWPNDPEEKTRMKPIPRDKIRHMLIEPDDPKRAEEWTVDDAQNMMAYLTYFPDGEIEYALVDKEPNALGIHEHRATMVIGPGGRVTDAFFMHPGDGAIYDIGKRVAPATEAASRNMIGQRRDDFKWYSQKLLDVINLIPPDDYAVCPERPGHSMTNIYSPMSDPSEVRMLCQDFLATQVMSLTYMLGINMQDITDDMPRLSQTPIAVPAYS